MIDIFLDLPENSYLFILSHPTGVTYEVQCGGWPCLTRKMEGFAYVECIPGMTEALSLEAWWSYKENLTSEEKLIIQGIVDCMNKGHCEVKIKEVIWEQTMEAWVVLKVEFQGVEHDAVFVWENCD
jgi:hypothetical protein